MQDDRPRYQKFNNEEAALIISEAVRKIRPAMEMIASSLHYIKKLQECTNDITAITNTGDVTENITYILINSRC